MNVKHSPKTLQAVKIAWEAGERGCEIMKATRLSKGSMSSMVSRNGWKRPWHSLKVLPREARKYYKKLRRCGMRRAAAFAEATKISAAPNVLRAALAPIPGGQGPASPPTMPPALNSGRA